MRNMKRNMIIILVLAFILSVLCIAAYADSSEADKNDPIPLDPDYVYTFNFVGSFSGTYYCYGASVTVNSGNWGYVRVGPLYKATNGGTTARVTNTSAYNFGVSAGAYTDVTASTNSYGTIVIYPY